MPKPEKALPRNHESQRREGGSLALRRAIRGALAASSLLAVQAHPVELPSPCAAGTCGPTGPTTWVTGGAANGIVSGNTLNVNQLTNNAILNWANFNISADGTVNFNQPGSGSVALNKIFQADPSRIFGALNANGRVYLLNQNGIIFGDGAQVNVGGLLASTLNITPQALEEGIAQAARTGNPAFQAYRDEAGNILPSGAVRIEQGANIETRTIGGQVLVFAPEIVNEGSIRTPDGQTILAAGQRVFLVASDQPELRGLLVEVGEGGSVTNGSGSGSAGAAGVGEILADRGNVTLAGALVRQQGRVSATTSVRSNGSVRLQARDTAGEFLNVPNQLQAERGGSLVVAEGSVTEILLTGDEAKETDVDANPQLRSRVLLSGAQIAIEGGARITATGGEIQAIAAINQDLGAGSYAGQPDASRLKIEDGAVLDVSGATVKLGVERNVVRAELRGNQLADSPEQREGALRSEPVFVDIRESGTRADGTSWRGTPLGDVSGDISNIRRGVRERTLEGGSILLQSQGAVLVQEGATLDVSGGQIDWQSGFVRTSQVLGTDGRVYDIADADRERGYVDIIDSQTVIDQRWGVVTTYTLPGGDPRGRFESGYVEGYDAGQVAIVAPAAVIDGSINGSVTIGPNQRELPASPSGTISGAHFTERPRGATLTLGLSTPSSALLPDYLVSNVEFASGFLLPSGAGSLELPEGAASLVRIRPELLGDGRVTQLQIFANDTVSIAPEDGLTLPGGGSLEVTAGRVSIVGDVEVPSGTIDILARRTDVVSGTEPETAPRLDVAAGSELRAVGQWVNDDPLLNPAGTLLVPLFIDGGRVELTANGGSLLIGEGSLIDVSAGIHRDVAGQLTAGTGGDISLAAIAGDPFVPVELEVGATLASFAAEQGGSLSISANSMCLGAASCSGRDGEFVVPAGLLQSGGFSSVSLSANLENLAVAPGADLVLRQRNLILRDAAAGAPTGTSMADITRVGELPDHLRSPMDLTLRAAGANVLLPDAGTLELGAGSLISGDPGARISLGANSRVIVEGTIRAPGGSVDIELDKSGDFFRDQAIWLGANSVIDVRGTAVVKPSDLNFQRGTVLAGGNVRIAANRGYVVATPGSVVDVSGTSAELDVRVATGAYERQTVGSAAGRIELLAAEGMQLYGNLLGRSGLGTGIAGGSLSVTLDTSGRLSAGGDVLGGDRIVRVLADSSPVFAGPGTPIPADLDGVALLPAESIEDGGFDFLTLGARNVVEIDRETAEQVLLGYGVVEFDAGTETSVIGRVILDAPVLAVRGAGEARVSSAYVRIGTEDRGRQDVPNATGGPGVLSVQGEFVDLVGNVAVRNVSDTSIEASEDIRARGVFPLGGRDYLGEFSAADSLRLSAQQVYPATLSQFEFAVTGESGVLTVGRAPGEARDVLSVGGALKLSAARVFNDGLLRAPVGKVTLEGSVVEVGSQGEISIGTDGLLIPFGTTQGGLTWAYQLEDQLTRVYGLDGVPLPDRRVVLDGDDVILAPDSVIDVSGGGDLLAHEFLPGPGGTRDILSAEVDPNLFAIVPDLDASFAPYDPREYRGFALEPGASIEIAAGSGLPAGRYALLPARYALLPGAYLVSAAGGYDEIVAGERFATVDGGTIVAGRQVVAGTNLGDANLSGFLVRPGSYATRAANYSLTKANDFFRKQAEQAGVPAPRVPRDAGTATLIASTTLQLDGILRADRPDDARGAVLELASPRLRVTTGDAAPVEGFVDVADDRLSAFGAQTIVLGGQLGNNVAGEPVDLLVSASDVVISAGAELRVPEVIVAARDLVSVEAGATIRAVGVSGLAGETLQVESGPSVLIVSAAKGADVVREGSGIGAGRIELATDSLLSSNGSIVLDAGSAAVTDGRFESDGGTLSFSAPQLAIGAVPDDFLGIGLDQAALDRLGDSSVTLRARESLQIFGAAAFDADALTLAAPRVVAGSGASATLAATQLTLTGLGSAQGVEPVGGDGTLVLSGGNTLLSGGTLAFEGFGDVELRTSGTLRATGDGSLRSAGDLVLDAGLVTAGDGVDFDIATGGNLRFAGVNAALADTAGLGSSLSFAAASISGAARILAPAGRIEMTAQGGDIVLGDGTQLDVSGRVVDFGPIEVAAPGGDIRLLAEAGSVRLESGSTLDVRGGDADGRAGSLSLLATNGDVETLGTLEGEGAAGSGDIEVEARSLDFDGLVATLTAGGFRGDWQMHLTGIGDLALAQNATITARSLALAADQGSVVIDGRVDARAADGGRVTLAARDAIEVAGTIDARATGADERGGTVDLHAGTALRLASGSRIDVGGTGLEDPALAEGGLVNLRLSRDAVLSVLDADPAAHALELDGEIVNAREFVIEGVARYAAPGDVIGSDQVLAGDANPWYAEAAQFAAQQGAIQQALGLDSENTHVRAGIEVAAAGDLTLAADWNLHDWRFDGEPGVLTLRAGGNLLIDRSLSDGFASVAGGDAFLLPEVASRSWSYRLAAGADLSGADPLATVRGGAGDLRLAPGTPGQPFAPADFRMIRTGTGRIDIASAGDVVLGNQASVIYTAGVTGPGIRNTQSQSIGGLENLAYPHDGGEIRISAGRDMIGAVTRQFYTEWQWRTGLPAETGFPQGTAWTINFGRFEQGIATLGGGDVSVNAGRDVVNLSASTPSVGRQVGSEDGSINEVEAVAGGDLTVTAGRDILGGRYYVDGGAGRIVAGREIAEIANEGGLAYGPLLALGDATLDLEARRGASIATAVNPTLLPLSNSLSLATATYFGTYVPNSRLTVTNTAGNTEFMADTTKNSQFFPDLLPDYPLSRADFEAPARVLPPTVRVAALAGTVEVQGSFTLWPSETGNLDLLARDDVRIEPELLQTGIDIVMSDAPLGVALPTIGAPNPAIEQFAPLLTSAGASGSGFNAPIPVHIDDAEPSRIIARDGDITMAVSDATTRGLMYLPEPVTVAAGRDILKLGLRVQHVRAGDVSTIVAGRDFLVPTQRDARGNVTTSIHELSIEGPGTLQIIAGRDIDLQTSRGIVSAGNLRNLALADSGASISLSAGWAGKEPAYDEFIDAYLRKGDDYDKALKAYVAHVTGEPELGRADALEIFSAFDRAQQRVLLEAVLFAELRAGGRAAADPGETNGDFTRAFAALETYYPGSNPDLDEGETNPYAGDIRLFFSRVYTLDGGDISLAAPGGEVNVGLAAPPAAFGIVKQPSELGVVAQSIGSVSSLSYSDFQVNESRVFAADGGDILVWSTASDIDAGRGAKTAISAPPPVVTFDPNGQPIITFPAALAGSGIQTLATSEGTEPGDVDLFAPQGVVDAGDAGIVAGNLTIAATAVLGASNIQVSGTAVGVPSETGGLGATLTGASSVASGASAAATDSFGDSQREGSEETPLADDALTWLEVFVVGMGDCAPTDEECLRDASEQQENN